MNLLAVSLLIATGLGQSGLPDDSSWRRLSLPNGALVVAQSLPNAKSISLQLNVSARGSQESAATHGLRHLIEHIVAKGPDKQLSKRLETEGMFLTAETGRDVVQFDIRCKPAQFELALKMLSELWKPLQTSDAEIAAEAKILSNEFSLLTDTQKASIDAWKIAYGEAGLDPMGSLQVIKDAKVARLQEFHREMFASANLTVTVAGPLSLDQATTKIGESLSLLPASKPKPWVRRNKGKPGSLRVDYSGEARAALVEGYSEQMTVATLAAGLGIASEFGRMYLTYTPSLQNGLITIGQLRETGLGVRVDQLSDADASALFAQGKTLAKAWILQKFSTPSEAAAIRGLMASLAFGGRLETMMENLEEMTMEQFLAGIRAFRSPNCVHIIGGKP